MSDSVELARDTVLDSWLKGRLPLIASVSEIEKMVNKASKFIRFFTLNSVEHTPGQTSRMLHDFLDFSFELLSTVDKRAQTMVKDATDALVNALDRAQRESEERTRLEKLLLAKQYNHSQHRVYKLSSAAKRRARRHRAIQRAKALAVQGSAISYIM